MADKAPGINTWYMANHMATQSQSLNKAAALETLGSRGKYLMTKAEKRRLKDRAKRARTLLASEQ